MTYAEHRSALLVGLAERGWKVQTTAERGGAPLQVPRATSPDGRTVLHFRRQAIYHGDHSLVESSKDVADAAELELRAYRRSAV